jgi:hypothetical protein
MIIAHLAYISYVAVTIIATVLSPFYTDIFQTNELGIQHLSAKLFIVLLERLTIASLFILVISLFYYVIFTHKFCGPLVNIRHTIARLSEKDFTRKIYIRKGDFLKKEVDEMNAMMKTLSNSIKIVKRENHLLIEDIDASMRSNNIQTDIDEKLKGFQDRAHRCKRQLDNFQLIDEMSDETGSNGRPLPASENKLSEVRC